MPHAFENSSEPLLGLYSQRTKSSQLPKCVCFDFINFVMMQVTEIAIRISLVYKAPGGRSTVFWTMYDALWCIVSVCIWDTSNCSAVTKLMMFKQICIQMILVRPFRIV